MSHVLACVEPGYVYTLQFSSSRLIIEPLSGCIYIYLRIYVYVYRELLHLQVHMGTRVKWMAVLTHCHPLEPDAVLGAHPPLALITLFSSLFLFLFLFLSSLFCNAAHSYPNIALILPE